MGIVLNGVMEFLVKPLFFSGDEDRKYRNSCSTYLTTFCCAARHTQNHINSQPYAAVEKVGKDNNLQRLLPLLSDLRLTWLHFIPYNSLSRILRVLVWGVSMWVSETCTFLTRFTLHVQSTTSTFPTKP